MRIYLAEAWLGYHGRFALTSPFGYFAGMFGFPFFLMLFFIYLGKHVGYADPAYIVIGNMLLIPAARRAGRGVTLAIADERQWGTLSVVLGSPAPRLPIFLGRSLIYIADGFVTSLLGLGIAALIFRIDLARVDAGALALERAAGGVLMHGHGLRVRQPVAGGARRLDDHVHLHLGAVHPLGRQLPGGVAAGGAAAAGVRVAADAWRRGCAHGAAGRVQPAASPRCWAVRCWWARPIC